MKKSFFISSFLFVLTSCLISQESGVRINHEGKDFYKLKHAWKAQWITHPDASTLDYGVFHFRRSFDLQTKPDSCIVHLSADNRYRLYVNGQYVSYGPSLGDINNYRYESLNIAPYLKAGPNVVAVEVVNFGEYRRAAQQSFQTAFILQIDCPVSSNLDINTGSSPWKVYKNPAYTCIPFTSDSLGAYYAAGPGEKIDAELYPWGWKQVEYDDSSWASPKAATVEFAAGRGFLYGSTWFLVPREIPLMEERLERFERMARIEGMDQSLSFFKEESSSVIPAHSKVTVLLDQKYHTTGFPLLKVSKGKGTEIKITYAEALLLPVESGEIQNTGHFDASDRKRDRNELEGKQIEGYYDIVLPDGGRNRMFKPLSRKTFRFVQLDIQTGGEELVIEDFYNIYTGYPFKEKASFQSDREDLQEIWDAAWRTLVNSSEEHFFDPYYEQLQYIGDTRIEALVSIYVSGDDRLMRKAIRQFDDSRIPEGLTQSRYPSYIVQVIPTYSLLWIGMVHDYFMYRNDPDFVREFIPGMKGVVDWFLRHQDSTGMVSGLEWWNFTDWATGFPNGIPPGADDGYSANVNLQLVSALQQLSAILDYFEASGDAAYYRNSGETIQSSVMDHCFDAKKGLLAETPDKKVFSQHSQIWGILTHTLPAEKHREVMGKVLGDSSLIQSTIYFKFYLFRAMQACGMSDLYLSMLDPWTRMLDMGMTTFGERDGVMRSECHGWSASPCFDLLHTTTGIFPLEPGFKSIAIHPNFGDLKHMKVTFPHPDGDILLDLVREKTRVKGTILLPEGTEGEFRIGQKSYPLSGGANAIQAR